MNLNKPSSCHVLQWISKGPSLYTMQGDQKIFQARDCSSDQFV